MDDDDGDSAAAAAAADDVDHYDDGDEDIITTKHVVKNDFISELQLKNVVKFYFVFFLFIIFVNIAAFHTQFPSRYTVLFSL